MNTISRVTIFGALFMLAVALWLVLTIVRSPYATSAGVIKDQPVPFSHKHHVADAGIDCRYCHTSVEKGPFAGIPPTQTCMNCHSQLWADSPMLEPVRASFRDDVPLVWNRVNDLPDYAYFDHSIHVRKGVACMTCHGNVAEMPLMWREATLHMEWCLECHRDPGQFVGPRELVAVAGLSWLGTGDGESAVAHEPGDPAVLPTDDWLRRYHINSKINCSVCHR